MENTFTYPTTFWLVPIFSLCAFVGWFLGRQIVAALFLGCVGFIVSWFAYSAMLPREMERWLASQPVYAILFRDFPQDKSRFISEYVAAYKSGGGIAIARKQEEMKIVMMEHHVGHYVARTPAEVLKNYIVAETWLISTLNTKNSELCTRYLVYSGSFEDVWRTVGSTIFTMSLRYIPSMITEAENHPEEVTAKDPARAARLYAQMIAELEKSGVLKMGTSCDIVYREYYLLSRMPPKDAALVLKLLLSEDHLRGATESSFFQHLLPFQ